MQSAVITSATLKQLSSEVTSMTDKVKSIHEKLSMIQCELKAPKNQYNIFGKYNYRSCEDILEAVKPLCNKYKTTLVIADELQLIGNRYYIMTIVTLHDWENDGKVSVTAYARESESKKGMDDSQLTGATSTYARKYALNGLFNIDDTKDNDTNENANEKQSKKKEAEKDELEEKKQAIAEVNRLIDILIKEWKTDVKTKAVVDYIMSLKRVPTTDVNKLTVGQIRILGNIYQDIILNKEKHTVKENQNG